MSRLGPNWKGDPGMKNEMTRKEFMQTVAGVAASAYVPAAAGAAAPAAKSKIKLGVSVYSYGYDLRARTMTLEDCIADIADMGADGVEILGESHVPDYPNPSEKWVQQWFGWMEKYKTKPTSYDLFVDTMFYKNRLLTPDEAVERMVLDFKLANRLGFKVLRQQVPPYKADNPAEEVYAPYVKSAAQMQVFEKALPYAEKYDVQMAVELHSPTQLKSAWIDSCLELIARTKTKYFGFMPDMSSFVTRPPSARLAGLVRQGAREKVLEYITEAYQKNLTAEKTVAEVKAMGGNDVELRWASIAGIYHFSNNDPKDLARLVPYTYSVHAKFFEMTDDLTEYSIPYDKVIAVLVQGGYAGYLSSEYEGERSDFQTSAQIRLQHAMFRKLLGMA
jgi:sugar phosphate isomerase/epimerase